MNSDRLFTLVALVIGDFNKIALIPNLKSLKAGLQNQVNQPQNPTFQKAVSEALIKVTNCLGKSVINDISPSWQYSLAELGLLEYLGENLRLTINEIFKRNKITIATASDEITAIMEHLQEIEKHLQQTQAGLLGFGIKGYSLGPGECEMEILIPRKYIDNALREYSEELKELNDILMPFYEITTGSRPDIKINSTSSSELNILLATGLKTGALIAFCIRQLVLAYKTILEIRVLHNKMREQGLSDEELKPVEKHARGKMKKEIAKIVSQVMKDYGGGIEKGRKQELKIELKGALERIINRIDNGFNFDVRSEEPEITDEQEESEEMEYQRLIKEAKEGSEYMKLEGEPILKIEEPKTAKEK